MCVHVLKALYDVYFQAFISLVEQPCVVNYLKRTVLFRFPENSIFSPLIFFGILAV